ncbi:MAG: hypothetical protein ABJP66_23080 [Hyphomicrobiales bacterium]
MKSVIVALGLLLAATISAIPSASAAGPGDVIISSPYSSQQQ